MEKDTKIEEEPKEVLGNSKPEPQVEEPKMDSALIKALMDKVDELAKQNSMLMEVADKKSLSTYYSRNQAKLPKSVRLNLINGKVIIGWKMTQNEVYKENIGGTPVWREKQSVKLTFADGGEFDMNYFDYIKQYQQIEANIISRTEDEVTGEMLLNVARTDNGEKVQIGVQYVN
jgi:hypothetical protein